VKSGPRAAEDGHAVSVRDASAAAPREAEQELVGQLLRARDLPGERQPRAPEARDSDHAGGELGEEGARRAAGDGGEGDGVERVLAVGGVR
jgi:hypothetical protein